MTIDIDAGRLTLSWPWNRSAGAFLVVFLTIWFGFLAVIWFSSEGAGWARLLPLSLHAAAGLWLTHNCLAHLFNQTVVTTDLETLTQHCGPIPVRRRRMTVPVASIEQLFVVERPKTSRRPRSPAHGRFELHALTSDGHDRILATGMPSYAWARQVEQSIENHLEIADRQLLQAVPAQDDPTWSDQDATHDHDDPNDPDDRA